MGFYVIPRYIPLNILQTPTTVPISIISLFLRFLVFYMLWFNGTHSLKVSVITILLQIVTNNTHDPNYNIFLESLRKPVIHTFCVIPCLFCSALPLAGLIIICLQWYAGLGRSPCRFKCVSFSKRYFLSHFSRWKDWCFKCADFHVHSCIPHWRPSTPSVQYQRSYESMPLFVLFI